MRISGDLAADLAEMMVHGGGIADRHDQRRRFARRRADRTKQIGRGEAEILGCGRPAAGFAPTPGSACSSDRRAPRPETTPRLACRVLAPPGLALIAIQPLRKLGLPFRIGL